MYWEIELGTFCDIFLDTHDDDRLWTLLRCLSASIADGVLGLYATNKIGWMYLKNIFISRKKSNKNASGVKQHYFFLWGFNVGVKNTSLRCPSSKVVKHVSHHPSKYFDSTLHPWQIILRQAR